MTRRILVVSCVLMFLAAGTSAVGAAPAPTPKGPPPGATDPAVTETTLATTICAAAAKSPKLSSSARRKVLARYRISTARRNRYVVDLLVPANLGGTTAARNLWPQLRSDATTKDATEELLHSLLCSGQIDLATAQNVIKANWTTAGTQAQAVADERKAAVGAFIAAQAEAERQAALAEYIASLPPPTTAPPVTEPPPSATRPRPTCEQLIQARLLCGVEGEIRCADAGTPYVCAFDHENVDGGRVLQWKRA